MGFFGFGKKNKEKEQEKMKTVLEKTRTGFWLSLIHISFLRCRRRAARGTSACVTWHRPSALLPASSTGWMKLLFKKGEKL